MTQNTPRPDEALVVAWREMAAEGRLYSEIARLYPEFSIHQVRRYCIGETGRGLPGPLQNVGRWEGANIWIQGERSPQAVLTEAQAKEILDDWDETTRQWKTSGARWARKLGVSPSTIHQLRRGVTWRHLKHPNQGRGRGRETLREE